MRALMADCSALWEPLRLFIMLCSDFVSLKLLHAPALWGQVGRLVLALQSQTNNVAEYGGLIIGLEARPPSPLWRSCGLPDMRLHLCTEHKLGLVFLAERHETMV